jgi:type I restriction enzyme M protein
LQTTKGISYKDLVILPQKNNIYNEFAKILRKNTISDYSNAFNKLFNLFLCKIVDEDNAFDDKYEMQFQVKNEETEYLLFDKISNLYEKGIKDYLGLDITDYSNENIE